MKATLTEDHLKLLGFKATIFIIEGYYHEKTDILIQVGANGENKQLSDGLQRITSTKITTVQEAKEAIQELELRLLPERLSMTESYIIKKKIRKMGNKFRQASPNISKRSRIKSNNNNNLGNTNTVQKPSQQQ